MSSVPRARGLELALVGLFLGTLGLAAPARAQELHVTAEGVSDPEALRSALAAELGWTVREGADAPRLSVALGADGAVRLVYTDEDGVTRERTAALSEEARAALAELVLVASNLVRDQVSALIADAPVATPVPDAAPPEPSAPVPAREAPLLEEPAVPRLEPPNFAVARPLRVGLEGIVGIADGASGVQPFGDYGLSLFGTVHEGVALGLTRVNVGVGYSSLESFIFAFSASPAIELSAFIDPRVQVWVQAGVSLQARTINGGLSPIQVAPFLAAGVRFWVTEWFTLGAQLAVHLTATDAFRMGGTDLRQLATVGTFGLSAEFHFDP
ncbi:MAG: hypothetical protein AB7S26_37915 [Sandaracinaceae bacterium]